MRWPMSRRDADSTATDTVSETPADPVSPAIAVDEIDDLSSSAASAQAGQPRNDQRPPSPRRIGWSPVVAYADRKSVV